MNPKKIMILNQKGSIWFDFLEEFFEETEARLFWCYDVIQALQCLSKFHPEVIFIQSHFSDNPSLSQKLKIYRQACPESRLFQLGHPQIASKKEFKFDATFTQPDSMTVFQKELTQHLPVPEHIDLLVVDDEKGVGEVLKDYLEGRSEPSFNVRYVFDGQDGVNEIKKKKPDILILDIKMPKMTGCEVFRYLKQHHIHIPMIMFFDVISGEEISEIRGIGKAAIVEKGSAQSGMSDMLALILKMVYFSTL